MAKTKTKQAVSVILDPVQASQDIHQQLGAPTEGFVLFYCSAVYPLEQLANAMEQRFTHVELAGCTTAGEVTQNGYQQHSLVAIWFNPEYFAVSSTTVKSIDQFDLIQAQRIINQLLENCHTQSDHHARYAPFLMTLIDGLSTREEEFLNTLNSAANGIPHFGGSAGDDINLANTHVYHQGSFVHNAAVVIMFNSRCMFEVFNSHHIDSCMEKMVVTAADPLSRTVYELNSEPAANEYARVLGIQVSSLSPEVFSLYPLAVKIGSNYYARAIQKVNDDLSLSFYCAVDTGIVLSAVEMSDIINTLAAQLEVLQQKLSYAETVLACDCVLRRLEIEQKKLTPAMANLQQQHRIFGFNTYGEHISGMHLNQTFTGVYISGELYD
ncbi:nitric oxide-sensing protein NosP [Vibrio panuliri]|uniref:GfdT protein n=1 Tax=Vibrio panuliri TaxID=1381081 RepID=A0ABX3FAI6_9VIBR|nr:nitric oxide-sensing protein NosP [Vibrio panuliri]KAB1457530.1 GfdT protein [Vibrio panuliri]OLQ87692.1 GfdT protein [Vibrio panuliri]